MHMANLLIIGAGGLGRMVGEVAQSTGEYQAIAFLDDAVRGADIAGKCVDYKGLTGTYTHAIAAFGDNALRLKWTQRLYR